MNKSEYNVFWQDVKPYLTDESRWFKCNESIGLRWPSTTSSQMRTHEEFIKDLWNHFVKYMIINNELVSIWQKPLFQATCRYGYATNAVVMHISQVPRSQHNLNTYGIMTLGNMYDKTRELHDTLKTYLVSGDRIAQKVKIDYDYGFENVKCKIFKPSAFEDDSEAIHQEQEKLYAKRYWDLYRELDGNYDDQSILNAIDKMINDERRLRSQNEFLTQELRYTMALRNLHFSYGATGIRRKKFFDEALKYLNGTHQEVRNELKNLWLSSKY